MAAGGHGGWATKVPGLEHVPYQITMSAFAVVCILAMGILASSQLKKRMKEAEGGLVPEPHWNFRNFFEVIAEGLFGLTKNVMGEEQAKKFFPLIGSLFLFIFFSNILGLIPGVYPATDNLNTTLSIGLFVFLYYNFIGLKEHGFGYLKHFLGPVLWLAPLILIVELASHVFRPISLALRLRGNIMGDHIVLDVFNNLVPLGLPVIFYGIGFFVCFIQAFVFCLMTMVYISLSASHDH